MERCCGSCFWFKRARAEEWAAPVEVGRCGFGPAPQVLDRPGARNLSANDGRECDCFVAGDLRNDSPLVSSLALK